MMLDPDTLEAAASRIENRAGNYLYVKAWRAAAKVIRAMKQEQKLTDNAVQIRSIDNPIS